jgi:hypothetical protein
MKLMLITSLLLMIMTIQAAAFDGQRQGFVIGGGLGGGTIAFKDEVTRLGQAFSFNVGYAPINLFQLQIIEDYIWNEEDFEGILGVGASYYFMPQDPSLFMTARFGVLAGDISGGGVSFGLGYEFERHVDLLCQVISGAKGDDPDESVFIFRITVNVTAY